MLSIELALELLVKGKIVDLETTEIVDWLQLELSTTGV